MRHLEISSEFSTAWQNIWKKVFVMDLINISSWNIFQKMFFYKKTSLELSGHDLEQPQAPKTMQ